MENIKTLLTANWSWMRILRLVIGLSAAVDAYARQDWLLMGLATMLIYQGVMNTGCGFGGGGSCSIPQNNSSNVCEK